MECNKDEAVRSKQLAEKKFLQHDLPGARKFAQKAKQLFPDLEGISQFISALDVHFTAEDKLPGGEPNWYSILQVDSSADEGTIRKQYRKLALLLHPDKNKSVGAEAAFKHISEAWSVLSDKDKKAAYDIKIQGKPASQNARVPNKKESSKASSKQPKQYVPAPAQQPPPFPRQWEAPPPRPPPVPRPQPAHHHVLHPPHVAPSMNSMPNAPTFWTGCPLCNLHFEYPSFYAYKNLCCPVCCKPFLAKEIVPMGGIVLWPPLQQENHTYSHHGDGFQHSQFVNNSYGNDNFSWQPFGAPPAFGNHVPQARQHTQASDTMPQEMPDITYAYATTEHNARAKKVSVEVEKTSQESHSGKSAEEKQKGQQKKLKEELGAERVVKAKGDMDQPLAKNNVLSKQNEEQSVVTEQIEKQLKVSTEQKSPEDVPSQSSKSAHGSPSSRSNAGAGMVPPPESVCKNHRMRGATPSVSKTTNDRIKTPLVPVRKSPRGKRNIDAVDNGNLHTITANKKIKEDPDATFSIGEKSNNADGQDEQVKLTVMIDCDDVISIPDYESYDFDNNRKEENITTGQIWAFYDDKDGMPRYYGKINQVSSKTFKLQIVWLESKSSYEGFDITCGEFRLGKTQTFEDLNTISHMVKFEKVTRAFKIYPHQGDIWAIYKDCDLSKIKDGKRGYVLVEILTDFDSESGVQVSKLSKLDGYKTIFHRKAGEDQVEWILPNCLQRFSHQVPSHLLTTEQFPGITDRCWELDPGAIPEELTQD